MKQNLTLALAALAVGTVSLLGTGCQKLKARDHLNQGVQSFKNAKYPEAVEHFKTAVELDPSFPTARLYLATAYMSQYIPGADSPENQANARNAQAEFMKVLEKDPRDKHAIKSLASLNYQQTQGLPSQEAKVKKLEEAQAWYEKLVQLDPNDKEAHYSLGVISWAKWYPALMTSRAALSMKPEDPGPIKDAKVKAELKDKYSQVIEGGINSLQQALKIDPEYDDAMAYLNLLIRERADLAGDPETYRKDIETADTWVARALETKKMKAAKASQQGGIVSEEAK